MDIFEAIDEVAVHHCGWCDAELGLSAGSSLFCSEAHQSAWTRARVNAPAWASPSGWGLPEWTGPSSTITVSAPRRERCSCGEPTSPSPGGMFCPDCVFRLTDDTEPPGANRWRARFAAPWNPGLRLVGSDNHGSPPAVLQMPRALRPAVSLVDPMGIEDVRLTVDTYTLESFDQGNRGAIYRIRSLQLNRYIVLRPAHGVQESWLGRFNGRWEELDSSARQGELFGGNCIVKPTVYYEVRTDGVFAEVWECGPRPGYRATEHFGQIVPLGVPLPIGDSHDQSDCRCSTLDAPHSLEPRRSR